MCSHCTVPWPVFSLQIAKAEKLKPMELELRRLEDLSDAIVDSFNHMRKKEDEMRGTNGNIYLMRGNLIFIPFGWLVDWLYVVRLLVVEFRSIVWLIDWLVGWLIDWLFERSFFAEQTSSRVLYFSVFSMLCLLGLTTWQVLYLRRFFKAKRLIEWITNRVYGLPVWLILTQRLWSSLSLPYSSLHFLLNRVIIIRSNFYLLCKVHLMRRKIWNFHDSSVLFHHG